MVIRTLRAGGGPTFIEEGDRPNLKKFGSKHSSDKILVAQPVFDAASMASKFPIQNGR